MSEQEGKTTIVGFRIPDSLHRRVLPVMKAKHFTSVSEYARDLVRRDIEAHEDAQPSTGGATEPGAMVQ